MNLSMAMKPGSKSNSIQWIGLDRHIHWIIPSHFELWCLPIGLLHAWVFTSHVRASGAHCGGSYRRGSVYELLQNHPPAPGVTRKRRTGQGQVCDRSRSLAAFRSGVARWWLRTMLTVSQNVCVPDLSDNLAHQCAEILPMHSSLRRECFCCISRPMRRTVRERRYTKR